MHSDTIVTRAIDLNYQVVLVIIIVVSSLTTRSSQSHSAWLPDRRSSRLLLGHVCFADPTLGRDINMDRKDRILPNFAIFFRSFLLIQKWNYPQNAGNFQSVFQNFPFFFHPKTEYAAFFRSFLLTQKWNLLEKA